MYDRVHTVASIPIVGILLKMTWLIDYHEQELTRIDHDIFWLFRPLPMEAQHDLLGLKGQAIKTCGAFVLSMEYSLIPRILGRTGPRSRFTTSMWEMFSSSSATPCSSLFLSAHLDHGKSELPYSLTFLVISRICDSLLNKKATRWGIRDDCVECEGSVYGMRSRSSSSRPNVRRTFQVQTIKKKLFRWKTRHKVLATETRKKG